MERTPMKSYFHRWSTFDLLLTWNQGKQFRISSQPSSFKVFAHVPGVNGSYLCEFAETKKEAGPKSVLRPSFKKPIFVNMQRTLLFKFYQFYSAKMTLRNKHKARKPLFHQPEAHKNCFLEVFVEVLSLIASKRALSSPNAFYEPKTFMKVYFDLFSKDSVPKKARLPNESSMVQFAEEEAAGGVHSHCASHV